MEDKLVTLAIRTYQRAQMIKLELEKYDIETVIHNLNTENPEVAVGVRVRIKQSDLPRALGIVEKIEQAWEKDQPKSKAKNKHKILLPIDLNDNIQEVCKYGFYFAEKMNASVVLLHAYYLPMFNIASNNDINTYTITDNEMQRRTTSVIQADAENMKNLISKWIENKNIPEAKFSFLLKEGVAEDVILDYCKKEKPSLIIMGTHGKNSTNEDNIGSVTSVILETGTVPTIAIPVSGNYKQPDETKKIAFLTNFDQKDLIAIDETITLYKKESLQMLFIHTSDRRNSWDEVMLSGIKTYFEEHYPGLKTAYAILNNEKDLEQIQQYLLHNSIDLVALNNKKRNIFARFFNQGIATKLLFNVDMPLLIMHL